MSGATGIRGYLVQTLCCLLKSLDLDSWETVSLEPGDDKSEKVDIRWVGPDYKLAVQVKSSKNQITKPKVKAWAKDLEEKAPGFDRYELQLFGPCTQGIIDVKFGKVEVPAPNSVAVSHLLDQAAHSLDAFLEKRFLRPPPRLVRELLVQGLVGKLTAYSTSGVNVSREELESLIKSWLLALYPSSVEEAVAMQCDVLVDTVMLPRIEPTDPPRGAEDVLICLPLVFVNGGIRTAIVDWVAIRVSGPGEDKRYIPLFCVDLQKYYQHVQFHFCVESGFSMFAVLPGAAVEKCVAFAPLRSPTVAPTVWLPGDYKLEVLLKLNDREFPHKVAELKLGMTAEELQLHFAGHGKSNLDREFDF